MVKKKSKTSAWKILGRILLEIIKIPYYLVKGIIYLTTKTSQAVEKKKIQHKREAMKAKVQEILLLKTLEGSFNDWQKKFYTSDSQIGIILGARGTGKTALGIKLLENFYAKKEKTCFAMGFNADELPSWVTVVDDIAKIKNDSFVLVDEGGILFNSRSAMSKPNKILSALMLVARHKNLNIVFISQNSSNLEVNILRQADYLLLKPSALLQKDFERKIIQKIYEKTEKDFKTLSKEKGLTYIHSETFSGYISNALPSFWKESISKSFK